MSKKNNGKNAGAAPGERDYHREVAGVSEGVIEFFRKTFAELHIDGPEVDFAGTQKSPVMIVSSHRSHSDYFLVGSAFCVRGIRNLRFAAGDNLIKLPWIGKKFLTFGAFSVSRDDGYKRNYVRNLCAQVVKMLEDGDAVLVFPEGGRSYTGGMLEIRGGILNAALMVQAAAPGRDVYLLPAAASYDCPPDAPWFPLLLKGKKMRKKPNGFFKRTLGAVYYFGADILAFAPFMTARFVGRRYGAAYMDYGAPVSVRSLVDLEANRVQGARDEFAAHKVSLDKVGDQVHRMFLSLYRVLPIHIISAAIKGGGGGNKEAPRGSNVDVAVVERRAADLKAAVVEAGRNCKTISPMTPEEIVNKGLAQLRKLKAVKLCGNNVIVRKAHIIDYFAETVAVPVENDM